MVCAMIRVALIKGFQNHIGFPIIRASREDGQVWDRQEGSYNIPYSCAVPWYGKRVNTCTADAQHFVGLGALIERDLAADHVSANTMMGSPRSVATH